jgi:hypothetical protein
MVMNKKGQIRHMITDRGTNGRPGRDSEKGAVLLVVVVLSAIALAIMTTLIYMMTVGTQITGIEKRYRSAHDASFGGWEIMSQMLATRGSTTDMSSFTSKLNTAGLSSAVSDTAGCTGTADGKTYQGAEAKLMTSSTTWSAGCDQSVALSPTSYDFRMQLGSGTKYTVYGKVVNTVQGNTSNDTTATGGRGLQATGTVNSASGVITVMSVPYLYTVEVEAENDSNPSERAKLSVLYQY